MERLFSWPTFLLRPCQCPNFILGCSILVPHFCKSKVASPIPSVAVIIQEQQMPNWGSFWFATALFWAPEDLFLFLCVWLEGYLLSYVCFGIGKFFRMACPWYFLQMKANQNPIALFWRCLEKAGVVHMRPCGLGSWKILGNPKEIVNQSFYTGAIRVVHLCSIIRWYFPVSWSLWTVKFLKFLRNSLTKDIKFIFFEDVQQQKPQPYLLTSSFH